MIQTRYLLLLVLTAGPWSCRSRSNESAVRAANEPGQPEAPAFFFHWGSVASNSQILATTGYQGAYPFDGTDIPQSRSEGKVTQSLSQFFYSIYQGHDAAGPGIYASTSFDSLFYGNSLLIVERKLGTNAGRSIPYIARFKKLSQDAWSSGHLETIPYLTHYGEDWYVIPRAPRDDEDAQLLVYGPAASDVPRIVQATLSESVGELLRLMASDTRASGPKLGLTAPARVFMDRLVFDDGFAAISPLDLGSLSDLDLSRWETVLSIFVNRAAGSNKTQSLLGKELNYLQQSGRAMAALAPVSPQITAGLAPGERAALLQSIASHSFPYDAASVMASIGLAGLSPQEVTAVMTTLRRQMDLKAISMAGSLPTEVLPDSLKLVKSLFQLTDAETIEDWTAALTRSYWRSTPPSNTDQLWNSAYHYNSIAYALKRGEVEHLAPSTLAALGKSLITEIKTGISPLDQEQQSECLGEATLIFAAQIQNLTNAAEQAAVLSTFQPALLADKATIAQALTNGESYVGALLSYLDLPQAATYLASVDPSFKAALIAGLTAAPDSAGARQRGGDMQVFATVKASISQ